LLKSYGLTNYRYTKKSKLKLEYTKIHFNFKEAYRDFNWRTCCVKFFNECSVQRGSGKPAEWAFRYPDEKYDPKILTEVEKGKRISQIVWAAIWIDSRGRVGWSELVIIERDFDSKKTRVFGR
jgi:hypothetical protein